MSDELPEEIDREVVLPPMKNNVFGLDRDLIMSKVSTTCTYILNTIIKNNLFF
jgi:hypothetical protein